jgi:hypothetical protein
MQLMFRIRVLVIVKRGAVGMKGVTGGGVGFGGVKKAIKSE